MKRSPYGRGAELDPPGEFQMNGQSRDHPKGEVHAGLRQAVRFGLHESATTDRLRLPPRCGLTESDVTLRVRPGRERSARPSAPSARTRRVRRIPAIPPTNGLRMTRKGRRHLGDRPALGKKDNHPRPGHKATDGRENNLTKVWKFS